jgi:hypothetical protein
LGISSILCNLPCLQTWHSNISNPVEAFVQKLLL